MKTFRKKLIKKKGKKEKSLAALRIWTYKEIINRYLSSNAKGEFFEGGDVSSARDYLTSEKNVKNKSVHCYAPLDYLVI